MFTLHSYKFNKIYLLNLLISFIPLGLIAGNTITNLNIILICIIGLYIYKQKVFIIKKKAYQYLIYLFFFYLILITLINNFTFLEYNALYKNHLIKSLLYLRYLFLFLIINKMLENKEFNIKLLFLSCSIFSLIIAFDIIFQFLFKKNIFGYPLLYNKASSFFQKEFIAGGFLQKFSLFFIFYLLERKIKNYKLFILITFIFFLIAMLFAGNKIPLFIFVLSFILFFLLEKKIKEIIIIIFLFFLLLNLIIKYFPSTRIASEIEPFFKEAKLIIFNSYDLFINNQKNFNYEWNTGYLIHFNSGVQVWKQNKIFGGGLKSFRLNCSFEINQTCNTHPHNYFIELMVDVGLFGLTIIYLIIILGLLDFLKFYYKEKSKKKMNFVVIFFILIFFEFFPFRSTGSFFTTSVSTFIFLMLPIFLNVKNLKKL